MTAPIKPLTVLSILTSLILGACSAPDTPTLQAQGRTPTYRATLNPTLLPAFTPSVINPVAGLYEWYHRPELIPVTPENPVDYVRVLWRDVATPDGHLDPVKLRAALHPEWLSAGQRLALRIQPLAGPGRSGVPDALQTPEICRTYGSSACLPDWTNPTFRAAWRTFHQELAAELQAPGALPVAWVDIGSYGFYGEWHMYLDGAPTCGEDPAQDAVSGCVPRLTGEADLREYVDMVAAPFTSTHLVMMTDQPAALAYAFSLDDKRTLPIGWRRDNLGSRSLFRDLFLKNLEAYDPALVQQVIDRHRKALVVSEFMPDDGTRTDSDGQPLRSNYFTKALEDARYFHVNTTSNGNFIQTPTLTEQMRLRALHGSLGVRPATPQITTTYAGTTFTAQIVWSNEGSSATSLQWHLNLTLVDSDGRTAATLTAPAPLNQLPVYGENRTLTQTVTGTLPTTSSKTRTYQLYLSFQQGTLNPWTGQQVMLTQEGRQPDGRYLLGSVTLPALN